jgi:tetratricopeptide (TPR) repeat protein
MAEDPELAAFDAPSPEHQIAALLKQGDDAKAAGDAQQAIEIWSRIFLLDINHAEAVARIEETRQHMAEERRSVASALGKGEESYAKGDLAGAKDQFDAVLALSDAGPRPTPATPALPTAAPPSPHDLSAIATPEDVLAEEMDQSGPPGRRSWSLPRAARESVPPIPTAEGEGAKRPLLALNRRTAAIAGAVLLLLAVGVFFLTRSPGGKSEPPPPDTGPSLERATSLFRQGKIAETAEELKRIPADHPDYTQAQKLLASLSARGSGASGEASAAPAAAPPAASEGSDAAALRAEAEKALAEKRYIDALKGFSRAAPHYPADPVFSQKMAEASEKVSELTPAVKLYNDAEYETAIPILWRIYQVSRENQDARSYLLRSYYNQGIGQIQNGLYDKAMESFGEVLSLDPQDVDAARHQRFAERYRGRELDLLGRIYLRYISPRP